MPEIRDLLQGAAPAPRPFDEDAIRSRVVTRRRRRRVLGGAAAVVVLALVGGVVAVVGRDDPEQTVVAQPAPEAGKQAGVTAVAVVDGEVWVGTESGRVGPENGETVELQGAPVHSLAVDDVLWAEGEAWVAAVDTETGEVLGQWAGDEIGDIQPLEGEHVAISQPSSGEVVIVRTAAEGLEELSRIQVGATPTNLVLTSSGDLWVNDGDVICRVDWGAGGAVDEQAWAGALLAPSASGGIWAVEGDRVVDLHPELLAEGQSVALGARYDHPGAVLAAAARERLYVAGASGIVQYAMNDQLGMPVTGDEPVAMAIDGDDLVYVAAGTVHRFDAEQQAASEPTLSGSVEAVEEVLRFVVDELGWTDAVISDAHTIDAPAAMFAYDATSPGLGRDARLSVEVVEGSATILSLWTFGDGAADSGAGVSLGNADGADSVSHVHEEAGLTPELTVRYGDKETVLTAPDESAWWEGDLGFVPDTPGWIQILWRNADGVALEGWREPLPAGPYNMG